MAFAQKTREMMLTINGSSIGGELLEVELPVFGQNATWRGGQL
jgi:hypothetical protein